MGKVMPLISSQVNVVGNLVVVVGVGVNGDKWPHGSIVNLVNHNKIWIKFFSISGLSNPHIELQATNLENSHTKEWKRESGTDYSVYDHLVFIGIKHNL